MAKLPETIQMGFEVRPASEIRLEEQQRIIKLLEEAECQGENDWCNTIEQAIALIKGEQE